MRDMVLKLISCPGYVTPLNRTDLNLLGLAKMLNILRLREWLMLTPIPALISILALKPQTIHYVFNNEVDLLKFSIFFAVGASHRVRLKVIIAGFARYFLAAGALETVLHDVPFTDDALNVAH